MPRIPRRPAGSLECGGAATRHPPRTPMPCVHGSMHGQRNAAHHQCLPRLSLPLTLLPLCLVSSVYCSPHWSVGWETADRVEPAGRPTGAPALGALAARAITSGPAGRSTSQVWIRRLFRLLRSVRGGARSVPVVKTSGRDEPKVSDGSIHQRSRCASYALKNGTGHSTR